MANSTSTEPKVITRDDLEASFRGVVGDVEAVAEQQRNRALIVGVAVVVTVVAVAFVFGRRRGQQNRTVVEIRRL